MIKYQLKCPQHHEFEGWFRNSTDYDDQSAKGYLACPTCGSEDVTKAIMSPAIVKGAATKNRQTSKAPPADQVPEMGNPVITRDPARLEKIRSNIAAAAERAREYVEKNFDYVGDEFPEEARRIHYGEVEERAIYGEATGEEVGDLVEEGVNVTAIPISKKPEVIKKADKKKLN